MDETVDLNLEFEPVLTHISVPVTEGMKARYKNLGRLLEDMGKKKVLTRMSRQAMEGVLRQIEQAVEAEQAKGA